MGKDTWSGEGGEKTVLNPPIVNRHFQQAEAFKILKLNNLHPIGYLLVTALCTLAGAGRL